MAGVNKVFLVGNLGKEPEIRTNQDGSKMATFTMATSEGWKDKATGERKEKTEWHRIVVFNPNLVDIVERFLHKGSKACVEGALQTRKWTNQNGAEIYTTEIVITRFKGEITLLDSRPSEGGAPAYGPSGGGSYGPSGGGSYGSSGNGQGGGGQGGGGDYGAPSGPMASGGMGSGMGGGKSSVGGQGGGSGWDKPADMDDDIPF